MAHFVVHPIYKKNGFKYHAPSLFIEANDNKLAQTEAKNKSGLARFEEWNFEVVPNHKAKEFSSSVNKRKFNENKVNESKTFINKTGEKNFKK